MKIKILIISLLAAFTLVESSAQTRSSALKQDEINAMNAAIQADSNLSNVIGWYGNPVEVYEKYKINLMRADSTWIHDQRSIKKIRDIGSTIRFEMIPLIDWFTGDKGLTGESGVSYLIKTDEATILFDLGDNTGDENPSPLLRNMRKLGIKPEDIGVIHNPIFVTDIEEQALAINVENKGIVIISGCGHQSIEKILQRTQLLFDQPLYGVLGGFHYPIEEGRNITSLYKYFVVGKLPWERLTVEDIKRNCELLKAAGVKLVGLSSHDSSDKSISIFRKEFPGSFVDIKVGEKISLN